MMQKKINWDYVFDVLFWFGLFVYSWQHKDYRDTFEWLAVARCMMILIQLRYKESETK